jgi:hypothetical protein
MRRIEHHLRAQPMGHSFDLTVMPPGTRPTGVTFLCL